MMGAEIVFATIEYYCYMIIQLEIYCVCVDWDHVNTLSIVIIIISDFRIL